MGCCAEGPRPADRVVHHVGSQGLTLNPSNCKSFTMTLRRASVRTKCFIDNVEADQVSEIWDLCVTLDAKLTLAPTCQTSLAESIVPFVCVFAPFELAWELQI